MELFNTENLVQMYFYIGIFVTATYLIKIIIFSFSGADGDISDGHIDVAGTDTDIAFSFLSVQSILAFFMGFGWSGLVIIKGFNAETYLVFIISAIFGIAFMGLSAYLTYLMKCLNQREVFDMNKCTGTIGKAYSTIKPHSEGQIEIEINSKLTVTAAYNDTDTEIPSFKPVKVVKYENNMLYIEQEKE